jgi:hypothetical protein
MTLSGHRELLDHLVGKRKEFRRHIDPNRLPVFRLPSH